MERQHASRRTIIAAGEFRGQSYNGSLIAYLDPNRRAASGMMAGAGAGSGNGGSGGALGLENLVSRVMGGAGSVDGQFEGSWDPSTGAIQSAFKGKVRQLIRTSIKGTISGQVERSGRGSGTFVGSAFLGDERGTWQSQPVTAHEAAAF